jgi:hypothetical protein
MVPSSQQTPAMRLLILTALAIALPRIAYADCASAFECFCGRSPDQLVEVQIRSSQGSSANVRIISVEMVAATSSVVLTPGETHEAVGFYFDLTPGDRYLAIEEAPSKELRLIGPIADGKVSCHSDDDFTPSLEDAKSLLIKPSYGECVDAAMALGQEEIPCNDTPLLCGCNETRTQRPLHPSAAFLFALFGLLSARRFRRNE